MQSLPQLRLHCNCKIVYVRPNSIEAALKKGKNERTQKRESLKQANTFNFNEACFFCEKRTHKDEPKVYVANVSTIDKMLEELDNRTLDQKEKILMVRLCLLKEKFNDLKPYYHKSCFKEFYRCKTRAAVGRPITDDTAKVVSYIIDYILENKDECQFSLNEILKDFDGDIPSFRNINEHLLLQFNEEIQTYFF